MAIKTDDLPVASKAEKAGDGISRILRGTSGPRNELAVVGGTLPLLCGGPRAPGRALGTPIGGGGGSVANGPQGQARDLNAFFQGLERMFDFGDGTNLLSEISAGSTPRRGCSWPSSNCWPAAANVTWTGRPTRGSRSR